MTVPPDQPTWRDDPDALDQLCDYGARVLHGGPPAEPRDTVTVPLTGDYL